MDPVRHIIWRLEDPHLAKASVDTPPIISKATATTHPRSNNDREDRVIFATICGETDCIANRWKELKALRASLWTDTSIVRRLR
ncbi:MAG: hypothetical protein FJ308_20040 [Planctomycetes bacterium]|nr:hypothetical protein [Planctomycetota bacterium]